MATVPTRVGEWARFTLVQTVLNVQWFGLYFYDVIMVYKSNRNSIGAIVGTLDFNLFLGLLICSKLLILLSHGGSREPQLPSPSLARTISNCAAQWTVFSSHAIWGSMYCIPFQLRLDLSEYSPIQPQETRVLLDMEAKHDSRSVIPTVQSFLAYWPSMLSPSHFQEIVSTPIQKSQSPYLGFIKTFLEKQNVCLLHQTYHLESIWSAGFDTWRTLRPRNAQ